MRFAKCFASTIWYWRRQKIFFLTCDMISQNASHPKNVYCWLSGLASNSACPQLISWNWDTLWALSWKKSREWIMSESLQDHDLIKVKEFRRLCAKPLILKEGALLFRMNFRSWLVKIVIIWQCEDHYHHFMEERGNF